MSMRCATLGIVLLTGAGSLSSSAAEGSVSEALQLRISVPKETFVQGEPVPITVEIRNRSQKDVEVSTDLHHEFGTFRFRVTDPEGETWTPGPHVQGSTLGRKTALNPGDRLTHTVPLVSGVVPGGVGRFIFRDTGRYAVQALYAGAVSSEPIAITIIEAQGLDIEAGRLFTGPEQREVPVGPGVSRVTAGTIRHMAREHSTSRDHFHIELFERILKDYKDFALSANVRYELCLAYSATGNKERAKECLKEQISKDPCDLAARRAEHVLRYWSLISP